MPTGKVKLYKEDKGFGFIAPDDGGPDVFFHASSLENKQALPFSGQRVTFEIGIDKRTGRERATNVR